MLALLIPNTTASHPNTYILYYVFHIWIQFSGHDLPSTEQAVTELPSTICTIPDVSSTLVHTTSTLTDDETADSSGNLSPIIQQYHTIS